MSTCQWSYETWGPHEGCAEFMSAPDVFTCPDAATVRFTFHDDYYVALSGDPDGSSETFMCAAHAADERTELADRTANGEIRDLAERALEVAA